MKHLIKSGFISPNLITPMCELSKTHVLRQLCTYLVAVNDRNVNRNKDLDPRDAYNYAALEIVQAVDDLVDAYKELGKK